MNVKLLLILTALSGFFSVALGAFGAHGLKTHVSEAMLSVYQTGVQYQMFHTLALLAVVSIILKGVDSLWLKIASYSWLLGILLFSGSLYLLALTGIKWLGAITPLGGLLFLVGWLSLALATWKEL
jgi:uncharacterized membrane protein YgdD (TMEM256/DUF423 family)